MDKPTAKRALHLPIEFVSMSPHKILKGVFMATAKKSSASASPSVDSIELQAILKRVKKSDLPTQDKSALADLLTQNIKLKKLVEKSKSSSGGKKVLASLPFGLDIVK